MTSSLLPRLSIGLPVYNSERYLPGALDSLLGQTFGDFELIISDNGSSDGTELICRDHARRDPRIHYLRHDRNRGAAWNHNLVLDLARSPYFKWASDDDLHHPEHLGRCVAVLHAAPEVVLCSTAVDLIDADGRALGPYELTLATDDPAPHVRFAELVLHWHGCFDMYGVIRTAALRRLGGLRGYAGSDRAVLAALALRWRFHQVPERLFYHREHLGRSITANPTRAQVAAWWAPQRRNRLVAPNVELLLDYAASVLDAPLSPGQRARCLAVLLPWLRGRWRSLGSDARYNLVRLTGERERVGTAV